MGPCPHHWLFEKVTAVVHHGGAGTTSTGLLHGCPTWICPFFGDQHFWGEMVFRAGLGPKPISVHSLTLQLVINNLELLLSDKILSAASSMASAMTKEDGIEGAVCAFYKHLPLENMLCDISLFKGEYRLAQVYCTECGLKMAAEVSIAIHSSHSLHLQDHIHNGSIIPCSYCNWSLPKPSTPRDGIFEGLGGFVHELTEGVADVVSDPVKGIYNEGMKGAATGLVTGMSRFVNHQITGSTILYERFKDVLWILKKNNNWSHQNISGRKKGDTEDGEEARLEEIKNELTYFSHQNSNLAGKRNTGNLSHDCSERTKEWRSLRILYANKSQQSSQLPFHYPPSSSKPFLQRVISDDIHNVGDLDDNNVILPPGSDHGHLKEGRSTEEEVDAAEQTSQWFPNNNRENASGKSESSDTQPAGLHLSNSSFHVDNVLIEKYHHPLDHQTNAGVLSGEISKTDVEGKMSDTAITDYLGSSITDEEVMPFILPRQRLSSDELSSKHPQRQEPTETTSFFRSDNFLDVDNQPLEQMFASQHPDVISEEGNSLHSSIRHMSGEGASEADAEETDINDPERQNQDMKENLEEERLGIEKVISFCNDDGDMTNQPTPVVPSHTNSPLIRHISYPTMETSQILHTMSNHNNSQLNELPSEPGSFYSKHDLVTSYKMAKETFHLFKRLNKNKEKRYILRCFSDYSYLIVCFDVVLYFSLL
jgi:hypothetical protein